MIFEPKEYSKQRQVDVSEWTDADLYVKQLDALTQLKVNDYIREYADPERTDEERVKSLFKIALAVLVDKDGNSAFNEEDFEVVKKMDVIPLMRIVNMVVDPDAESFKKKS